MTSPAQRMQLAIISAATGFGFNGSTIESGTGQPCLNLAGRQTSHVLGCGPGGLPCLPPDPLCSLSRPRCARLVAIVIAKAARRVVILSPPGLCLAQSRMAKRPPIKKPPEGGQFIRVGFEPTFLQYWSRAPLPDVAYVTLCPVRASARPSRAPDGVIIAWLRPASQHTRL